MRSFFPWWITDTVSRRRYMEKVFERFFQADSIMSQKVGGTGLGLTISKGIVEEHGGSISFISPIPEGQFPDLPLGGDRKGTAFFVHVPVGGKEDRDPDCPK